MNRWCRTGEAAALLGVSRSTIRRLIERGHLRAHPGYAGETSWYLVDRDDVVRLVRSGNEPRDPEILRV